MKVPDKGFNKTTEPVRNEQSDLDCNTLSKSYTGNENLEVIGTFVPYDPEWRKKINLSPTRLWLGPVTQLTLEHLKFLKTLPGFQSTNLSQLKRLFCDGTEHLLITGENYLLERTSEFFSKEGIPHRLENVETEIDNINKQKLNTPD